MNPAQFGGPKIKALKKSQKLYFNDWNAIIEDGARFENFITVHLIKWIYHFQGTEDRHLELQYLKSKYPHVQSLQIHINGK